MSLCARPVVLAAMLAASMPARADEAQDYIRSARQLYESLDFERALDYLDKAKAKSRRVEQDVEIALYEGILYAELARQAEAEAAFQAALLLDAQAKLPVKVAPKVAQTFQKVRGVVLSAPRRETPRPVGPRPEVRAVDGEGFRPQRKWAWVPAVGGAVLAGGGLYLLTRAYDTSDQLAGRGAYAGTTLSVSQARQLASRGEIEQSASALAIGAGVVVMAGAGLIYFLGDQTEADLTVLPTGAGISIAGAWR